MLYIYMPLLQGNKRIFGPQNGQKGESSPFYAGVAYKILGLLHLCCSARGPQTGTGQNFPSRSSVGNELVPRLDSLPSALLEFHLTSV